MMERDYNRGGEEGINETKGDKNPGMDGVRVEMLKEGGVTVLEWLVSV